MDASGDGQRSSADKEPDSGASANRTATNRNPFHLGLTAFGSPPTFQTHPFRISAPVQTTPIFEQSSQQTTRNVTHVFPNTASSNVFRGFKLEADSEKPTQKFNVFAVTSTNTPVKLRLGEPVFTSAESNDAKESVSSDEKTVAVDDQVTKLNASSVFSHRNVRSASGLFDRAMADVKSNFGGSTSHSIEKPIVKKSAEDELVPLKETVFLTPGEISRFTGIICRGVPDKLNNKQFIVEHFGKFGNITKVICNKRKALTTIHFDSGSSAMAAKQNGTILREDLPPVVIFFSTSSKVAPRSSSRKSGGRSKEEMPDDVNIELRAMEGHHTSSGSDVASDKTAVEEVPSPMMTRSRAMKLKHDTAQRQAKDNQASDSPKYTRSENTENLHAILNTPAITTEEKFNVLQVRDKLIRLKLKRHSDITTAIATAGICPDMCPEKERYLREDKRQLHYYETKQLTDKEKADNCSYFDSKLLVKEYSRSSADQEEPLSHELRPTEILEMTMNYLLCNIVQRLDDGSEDNATEWFDFLWNRTRAIRKDITQQHLCNQTCVALVEKCARFHIHCSVRMCEEDMINFDSKINNENLTKCLQTLKHFYADLATVGEKCPNEPEFQAYNVLLNLNEGDILRHVQHLSPEVRQSPEIGFALQVFSALNSNNYVRFFKLVKKSDYLSACVLHRYFLQIRVKTLLTIIKAYCPPNHHAQFSLDKITSLLAFDDQEEALYFFNSYGFTVENNLVVLDRSKFCEPDTWVSKRPRLTVESKRTTSVAVILNGGVPLAPNPIWTYEPHVSFASNGLLKTSAVDAKDQLETLRLLSNCGIGTAQEAIEKKQSSVRLDASVFSNSEDDELLEQPSAVNSEDDELLECAIVSAAEDLIQDVTQELNRSQCTLIMSFYRTLMSYATPMTSALIWQEILDTMKQISEDVIEEAVREREEENRKREYEERMLRQKMCDLVAVETQYSVMETVIVAEADQVASESISEMWTSDFLKATLHEDINLICAEILAEECILRKRKQRIEAMMEKRKMRRMKLTVAKWRSYLQKRRNRRRSMETFPTSFIEKSPKSLQSSSTGILLPVISPPQIAARRKCLSRNLYSSVLLSSLSQQLHTEPFDLGLIADPRITKLWPARTNATWFSGSPCWKLCVDLSNVGSETSKWMKQKLAIDRICEGIVEINVGFLSELSEPEISTLKLLFGSQGIIYVHDTKVSSLIDARTRLHSLFTMKPPIPAIPLLIVTVSECNQSLFSEQKLDGFIVPQHLTSLGYVSDWNEIVINIEDDLINTPQLLHSGLCWLADRCPIPPHLIRKRLDHFIEDAVQTLFTENVQHHTDLQSILLWPSLFNMVIEHAAAVASDKNLSNFSWPPSKSVNDWNSEHFLNDLFQVVLSLKLPPFVCEINEDSFWEDNCKLLLGYVQELDKPAPYLLMHKIESYMMDVEHHFAEDDSIPEHLPWTYTFHKCIAYQMDKLKLHQQQTAEPTMVVYDPEKLDHFCIDSSAAANIPRQRVSVKRKLTNSALMDELPLKKVKESAYESCIANNSVISEMRTRLAADVEAGKAEMLRYERLLEGLIDNSWPDDELSRQYQPSEDNNASYQPDFQKMSLMDQLEYLKVQVSSCKRADDRLDSLLSKAN